MLSIFLKPTYLSWDLAMFKQWTTLHLHKVLHKIPFPSILWRYIQRISKKWSKSLKVCFFTEITSIQLLVNWWFGFLLTIGWFMLGSQQIQGLDRTTCLYARIFLTTQWNETWGPFRTGRVWQVVGWWGWNVDCFSFLKGLLLKWGFPCSLRISSAI